VLCRWIIIQGCERTSVENWRLIKWDLKTCQLLRPEEAIAIKYASPARELEQIRTRTVAIAKREGVVGCSNAAVGYDHSCQYFKIVGILRIVNAVMAKGDWLACVWGISKKWGSCETVRKWRLIQKTLRYRENLILIKNKRTGHCQSFVFLVAILFISFVADSWDIRALNSIENLRGLLLHS